MQKNRYLRTLIVVAVAALSLACHHAGAPSPIQEGQGFRAVVRGDSATFTFPTQHRAVWEWDVPTGLTAGAAQYMWEAVWGASMNPYTHRQGFQVGLRIHRNPEPRTGTLQDLLGVSGRWALLPPSRGLDVAFELHREDALSATARNGYVVIVLRRSSLLLQLIASRPDSVVLSVDLAQAGVPEHEATVRIEYRK